MKNNIYKYIVILFLFACVWKGYGQAEKKRSGLYLFADRASCISGDTVWFKVAHENGNYQKSNIVHVQLTSGNNRVISEIHKKSTGGWAEGYIHVPDSLSSGVYFLSAFSNGQKSYNHLNVQKKSLFVYNRFQKMVSEISVPVKAHNYKDENLGSDVLIKTGRLKYEPREKVTASVNMSCLHSAGIRKAVIKAELLDELAQNAGGNFYVSSKVLGEKEPEVEETDGIFIKGKVVNRNTNKAGENVLVLFSLLNDPLYFDYCITSKTGNFRIFLKDAYGSGDIVLQAFSEDGEELEVLLETQQKNARHATALENRLLTPGQSKFIEEMIDAAFYSRLFGEINLPDLPTFQMTPRFEMPFYGNPYKQVVLSEYVELKNFREVARELLPGVQYRQKNENAFIRMLNLDANMYFEDQPFRLINGIPVFKNSLLTSLGSNEIDYIDYVLEDRIYGDLRFSGVLAVYLKNRSNAWMAAQPNLHRFTVPLLQPEAAPGYMNAPRIDENIPDTRKVFYWQLHDTAEPLQLEFFLSDIKGKVIISVEGATGEGVIFNASEIIEVK